MDGMTLVFEHVHVWVNRGEWRSGTYEGDAIQAAQLAAFRSLEMSGRWSDVMEADLVQIARLPCEDSHTELCKHFRVSFWKREESMTNAFRLAEALARAQRITGQRFGQIISNITASDPFYIEDEDLVARVNHYADDNASAKLMRDVRGRG